MANQAGTSSADSPEQQIKRKHSRMVIDLSRYFSPDLEHWEELLQLLSVDLEPVYLRGKDNNFMKICEVLMAKGIIRYGSYDYLYEVISSIDVRPAEIIKKASDEIKDIQSRGPSQANRRRTEEGDQTKDWDPRLTAMIETTRAMIMKEKDEYEFFSTKSLQEAYDKLMKNSLVVIRGNSGDGKTSIALELLRRLCYNEEGQQRRQPQELYDIEDLDSVKPKSQLVIYLDDIFGKNVVCKQDVEEWEKREKSIISKFCGNEHTEGNFLIIAIRSGISNSLPCSCLEKVFTKQNIVDLKTDSEEKLKLLRLYKPKDNFASWKDDEEKEIVKCAPDIGFPQCCRLFRDTPTLQMERVDFFKRPFHFLKTSLSKLEDGKCYGLMYLFLNGGKVMEDDLDPNNENIDENLLEAAFANDVVKVTPTTELVHNTRSKGSKIEFVKDSLDCLSGWMVKKEPLFGWMVEKEPTRKQKVYYKFNHDSIEETLALLYGEKTPIGYIQNCPIKFLSYVTTSNTTPNKVVISSDNQYNVMYKRLLSEFESVYSSKSVYSGKFGTNSYRFYRCHSITSLDVWTEIQILKGFIRWLSSQNVDINLCHEIKLALLNGACSSGSEECALFLLPEGVKPDEETPFCVVEGGSVNLLHKLQEYDVTQTARLDWTQSPYKVTNINVLQEACLFEREEMVTILCNTYPNLVHDTDDFGHSTLHLAAQIGNCDIFKTVERIILKSLYRVEDEQHKCERVEGRVVHRSCVCDQYMCQLVNDEGETVLHDSCYYSDLDFLKYLCESYPQLTTAVDDIGQTVLHVSCGSEYSNMDVVKYLCESYPQLTTAVDNTGLTVLHASCEDSNMDVVKYLCESYPQLISAVDNTGLTVLHVSCEDSNMDVVKYLCESYPQLISAVNNTGLTVLHVSCMNNNMDVVKYLCESYPQLTTAVDNTGWTVLHVSCRDSNMDLVKYLCESNPQLTTAVTNTGWTVLHVSCRYKKMDVVKYLCESNPQLTTAVDIKGWTVLHVSCRYSNMDVVKYLCESHPQLITAVDNTGETVLHVSCGTIFSNMDVIEYLCESYPQLLTAVDYNGQTVLHVSCGYCNMDVIKYLCKSYPQLTTAVTKTGWHCLHFIARYRSDVNLFTECESIVKKYIISTGGKYDITTILTNQGESVLDLAKEWPKYKRVSPLYDYLVRLFRQQKQ